MSKRKLDESAIKLFENKTGRSVYTMEEVAAWIEKNHIMPMPEPVTPQQMLAKRLAKSASASRRTDPTIPAKYRGYHSIRVETDGQIAWHWFDADGAAASEELMERATRPRRDLALSIGVSVTADWRHFYRVHPTATPRNPDFDLNWEIQLRLGIEGEEAARKAS